VVGILAIHVSVIVRHPNDDRFDRSWGKEDGILTGPFVDDDPAAPIFFLSYARANPRGRASPRYAVNEHVARLFKDLSENVAELLPSLPGKQLGFMDTTMQGGEDWRRRLLYAAGTCQVFIALLSPNYLDGSPWCAMEWDLFSKRTVKPRSSETEAGSGIIPSLWAPTRTSTPRHVSAVQRFAPSDYVDELDRERYRAGGIFGLLRTNHHDAYMSIVWDLAMLIQTRYYDQWVEPQIRTDTRGLRRSFRRARP